MNPANQDDHKKNGAADDAPLGLRLRHAREAAGLSVADVAERLRLKSATVESLEREAFDALGAPVYVRGYYNSYARLLGVPTVLVERVFAQQAPAAPALHTTARISHSRYLFDRYAKRAVYLVLTASIVVPVILLATRNQLPRQGATLTSLDAPAMPERDGAAPAPASPPVPAKAERSAGETPVMASLGPFYAPQLAAEPIAPVVPPVVEPVADASLGLALHLTGDSWIEVLDHAGRRLDHGVFRAGDVRRFDPSRVGKVSIGNAGAVEVRVNGAVTDIAAFRRANVARFTVSSEGSLVPAGG